MNRHKNRLPAFSLRKGLGAWNLIFNRLSTVLKHEQGVSYVAYLLANPPLQPVHAVELLAKAQATASHHPGPVELIDPRTGIAMQLDKCSRIQERGLGVEDLETLRSLRRKKLELEAILDDADEQEPLKAEALRDLEQILAHQRRHMRWSEDNAQKTVRAVRRAIARFHSHLQAASDSEGRPHPILRPFAAHLEQHLLIPSSRYYGRRSLFARSGLFGCFTYEPPPGVIWEA
jgi:hypothetical protein